MGHSIPLGNLLVKPDNHIQRSGLNLVSHKNYWLFIVKMHIIEIIPKKKRRSYELLGIQEVRPREGWC